MNVRIYSTLLCFLLSCSQGNHGEANKPLTVPDPYGKSVRFEIANNTQDFKSIQYDRVEAYDYKGSDGEHLYPIIDAEGHLLDSALIYKSHTLTPAEAIQITGILGDRKTYEDRDLVHCYEPRLAFVYFQGNKVVGQVMICLRCKKIESTIPLPDGEHYVEFGAFGKKQFGDFCASLGFSSCQD